MAMVQCTKSGYVQDELREGGGGDPRSGVGSECRGGRGGGGGVTV